MVTLGNRISGDHSYRVVADYDGQGRVDMSDYDKIQGLQRECTRWEKRNVVTASERDEAVENCKGFERRAIAAEVLLASCGNDNSQFEKRNIKLEAQVDTLKADLSKLDAKFKLDVGIMLENQIKLTEERGVLKEQVKDLDRRLASAQEKYITVEAEVKQLHRTLNATLIAWPSAVKIEMEKSNALESRLAKAEVILDGDCHRWCGDVEDPDCETCLNHLVLTALGCGVGEKALTDMKEGRTKSFKTTEDLFKDLDEGF